MASSYEEPAFRACGLCASIVHEAVEVREEMRKFLIQFLNLQKQKKEIENDWEILPVKICITCYQEACAAKRFKDSCLKSIAKLNNKEEGKIIPRSWIIGWSTEEIDAAASRAANDVVLKSNKTRIEDAIKVLQSKISCEDTSKITRSKTKTEDNVKTDKPKEIKDDKKLSENEKKHDIPTKTKNEDNVKTDKPKEIKGDKKVSENEKKHDIPTINDHLKVQPVVEISWNERQMGEINLKRCEVTLNSIGAAGFQGKQCLLAKEPSTNTKAIGLLPPSVPKTDLKVRHTTCTEFVISGVITLIYLLIFSRQLLNYLLSFFHA